MTSVPVRHRKFTIGLGPEKPHLSRGEVADLRRDVVEAFERASAEIEAYVKGLLSETEEAKLAAQKYAHEVFEERMSGLTALDLLRRSEEVENTLKAYVEQVADGIFEGLSFKHVLAKIANAEDSSKLPLNLASTAGAALSGDLEFAFPADLDSRDVSAATLNAAAAGTYKEAFCVMLKTTGGLKHSWATFAPVLTGLKTTADGDIGVPTLNSPSFDGGACVIEVTFDTDGGATKTYAAADEVSVDIQVKADDTMFGMWTVTKATFTFNVV
jgi:hypothetical protein